jgi:hypothetical protein
MGRVEIATEELVGLSGNEISDTYVNFILTLPIIDYLVIYFTSS